jgi:CDP-paratose 2-epimerase
MKYILTGGFGFIGTNFSEFLLNEQHEVVVVDDLSRTGAARNRIHLNAKYPNSVVFVQHDLSLAFPDLLLEHISQADTVIHLAAQVAVTTSVLDPYRDFMVNALGTLNLLEALRTNNSQAVLLYSSTNKVYGDLSDSIYRDGLRYVSNKFPKGVDETVALQFHSPYGCSKGSADQYVLDYSRMYGLKGVAFRQSCIYGRHQYGTLDQGWASWLMQRCLTAKGFEVFGDGLQVRDMLNVVDLYHAYKLAEAKIERCKGHAFNLGGGISNSMSILEFIDFMRTLGLPIDYRLSPKRPGDQEIFISDNRKFTSFTGWEPQVGCIEGLEIMYEHLKEVLYEH